MTPPAPSPRDPAPRFLTLFLIALAIRCAVVVFGLVLATQPPDPYQDPRTPARIRDRIVPTSARPIEPWYRYDAVWHADVALNGYAGAKDSGGHLGPAFMPALPATMAAANALGLNPFWVGLIVANLAAAAGAAVFTRVAARLLNDRAASLRAFVLIHAFPTAFFLSAPYNEAFGLLFTSLALSAWLAQHTGRAALFAALGSLARMTGLALGAAALAGWFLDDRSRGGLKRALLVAAGSFGGLALFLLYLYWAVGDPLAALKTHAVWGRKGIALGNVWPAIQSIYHPVVPHWGETFCAAAAALLGIRAWLRRGAFWGVLTLVPVAQMMLSGTFLSGHRVVLACLPAFIELADLLKNRLCFLVVVVGFAVAQFILLNRQIHWIFAG
jgi:hypothetical protein